MARTVSFALRVLKGRIFDYRDRNCPYCHSVETHPVGRKHLILQLRVCDKCGLKYRFPKDDPLYARNYFENVYNEPSATDLPAKEEVTGLIAKAFKGSCFDRSDKADFVLSRLSNDAKDLHVLDYGASFGYLMSQLRALGFKNLIGYEISRKRARFGTEYLNEEIVSTPEDVLSHSMYPFDVIIASHVLEHLTRIGDSFNFFRKALGHPGGRLFIWVPNASQPALDRFHNGNWAPLIGEPHQLAFDYDFFFYSLPRHGFQIVETGDPSDAEIRLLAQVV